MASTYILRSESSGRYYVGSTNDLERRLSEHLRSHSLATRGRGPWRIVYESLFGSAKRKLSARAPGRSLRTQKRQALLLGLSLNLYRLKHQRLFLRMSTEPDGV